MDTELSCLVERATCTSSCDGLV